MKTSQRGIELIKKFEGCRLIAYKAVPSEKYYTIGYGHYGADVAPQMIITQAQAEAYLRIDLDKFERAVENTGLYLNQNQFDALVSFAYNCGVGNLKNLTLGRTPEVIAEKILAYNKAGGKVLPGLTNRRYEERNLFVSKEGISPVQNKQEDPNHNPYHEPTKNVRMNTKGNDARWLQYELNKRGYKLKVDGHAGELTIGALIDFQKHAFPNDKKEWDGICGSLTRSALKR